MKLCHARLLPEECTALFALLCAFLSQNNLVFLAAARLPSSVIQVLQQVKLFWTAAFSIVILKRSVFFWQWMALVVLMAGATIV